MSGTFSRYCSTVNATFDQIEMKWAVLALALLVHGNLGLGQDEESLSRHDFSPNFLSGAGTSAYQMEGGGGGGEEEAQATGTTSLIQVIYDHR